MAIFSRAQFATPVSHVTKDNILNTLKQGWSEFPTYKKKLRPFLSCLVLSCFFRVHPLGGLFLAHAEAGLHCTVQSITPPWAGCSGLVHLNQSRGVVRLLHMYCPSSTIKIVENTIRSDLSISPISLEIAQIPIILLSIILLNSPFG